MGSFWVGLSRCSVASLSRFAASVGGSTSKVRNPEFLSKVASICKKDDYLVMGCNNGGRSLLACIDLLGEGFEHVTNMKGGYSAWVDSGLAGDKPAEELKTFCKFRP